MQFYSSVNMQNEGRVEQTCVSKTFGNQLMDSFKFSVEQLMNDESKNMITELDLVAIVNENSVLTNSVKTLLFEYMRNLHPHPTFNVTFKEVCRCVFTRILSFPKETQNEIFGVLNSEISDGFNQCFTGQFKRLLNCLNGFDSRFGMFGGLSQNEELSNVVIMVKERLEKNGEFTEEKFVEEVEKEFREKGVEEQTINEWKNYL